MGLFSKKQEAENEKQGEQELPPPPYSENDVKNDASDGKFDQKHDYQGQDQGQCQQGYQQGYLDVPQDQNYQQGYLDKPQNQNYQQGYEDHNGYQQVPQNNGYQFGGQGYDSNQDPNVYNVPPELVDISRANPQHLNPAYQQYLRRDAERVQQGDIPKGRENFKHGAPLNPGTVNNNKKTSGFPGAKGGATYNNAANR